MAKRREEKEAGSVRGPVNSSGGALRGVLETAALDPEREAMLRKKIAKVLRSLRDALAREWQVQVQEVSERYRGRPEGDIRVDYRRGIEALLIAVEEDDVTSLLSTCEELATNRWQTQFVVSEVGEAIFAGTRLIFRALAAEATDVQELMDMYAIFDQYIMEGLFYHFQIYQRLALAEVENQTRLRAQAEEEAKFARERQKLLEELRSQEERLAAIIEGSADAIIALDNDDNIVCWNRGAESIFGYTREEMIGRPVDVIVPGHLEEAGELEMIAREVRDRGFIRGYETERLTKDRRRIKVDLTSTVIRDADGKRVGTAAILRDITDRERLRERVLQAERLATIGRMAARVAHEVRNPLSSITLNADLLADELRTYKGVDTAEADVLLRSVNSELERLNQVVREYLSFVRLPEPRFEQHDIVRVTKDLLDFLEEEMSGKGVRLKREFGDGIPLMLLDVHKMREALINLLKNGSEAMPGGGEITTRIARQGEEVLITISDTGVGIPEDRIESIFQPFTSTKEGGTGLGLPVAQEIIAEHGGAISCASKVGEGSTFEIRLPLEMGSRPRLSPREVTDPGSPQGAGPTARCG